MAVDMNDLLTMPVDAAEKPKPRPAGTYQGQIGQTKFDTSSQKKTPYLRLSIASIQPGQDVDSQALQDAGGAEKWNPYIDYYLTTDAIYRLRELMESCKLKITGRPFKEVIPELKGQHVLFTAAKEMIQDQQTGESREITKIISMKGL